MSAKSKQTKAPAKPSGSTDKNNEKPVRLVSDNRRARHEYEILQVYECGIELQGTEVKSLRTGRCSLQDSFGKIEDAQVWLYNCHISPYDHGNRFNHEPTRKRRLLLHSREILKIHQQIKEKGLTLIPLRMFFKRNWVKVDIALARGKHLYDKRESIAKRDTKRQLDKMAKQIRQRDQ
ncbi:MAG: SsrA-binding protein SmpB [Candidatus Obscuribacterales bacterium]|jgi:SsrA-binding protein|nr:SsrA-binding protein SmpB [Candidatus Obscuribacterales bacterium]